MKLGEQEFICCCQTGWLKDLDAVQSIFPPHLILSVLADVTGRVWPLVFKPGFKRQFGVCFLWDEEDCVCWRIVDWCHRASVQISSCHAERAVLGTNVPTAWSFIVGAGGHGGMSHAPQVAVSMWEGSFGHSW